MLQCRVPVIAAVNGPAVGLGCSLVSLSDVVFMARSDDLRNTLDRVLALGGS